MHTFVYQFERSVIDHYKQISLYKKSFCTEIIRISFFMAIKVSQYIERNNTLNVMKTTTELFSSSTFSNHSFVTMFE